MQRRARGRTRITSRKGVFNPDDQTKVKHTRLGVWDLYEEKEPELSRIPGSSRLERFLALKQSLPYLWMMLKDIGSIRSCWVLLVYYVALVFAGSLIPAVSIWYVLLLPRLRTPLKQKIRYKGQMLTIVRLRLPNRLILQNLIITSGRSRC